MSERFCFFETVELEERGNHGNVLNLFNTTTWSLFYTTFLSIDCMNKLKDILV